MTTQSNKRSIFRDKALERYRQNQEKSILPRVVAPPVFLFCWILVIVLSVAVVASWMGQLPSYTTASGVIPSNQLLPDQGSDEAVAVLLFPVGQTASIRVGLPAQAQIGQAGPNVPCKVSVVDTTLLSPTMVSQQYGISVTDPTQVIMVRLGNSVPRHLYAGSHVQVQIQTGSRRLLSLFPLLSNVFKEEQ